MKFKCEVVSGCENEPILIIRATKTDWDGEANLKNIAIAWYSDPIKMARMIAPALTELVKAMDK